ncbi:sulfotransferase [Luteolibacter sp. SL250]|uniref:sulfotransferase n=1 Tax=Luteolibacter sp. SL250 TaxID=2995170 RepID=UPI00226D8829|nr:sulfotransferase [Luteolibacter sp. SL250]WAC20194.1 sulfotransferase [Luteolibacter sp. SL250]
MTPKSDSLPNGGCTNEFLSRPVLVYGPRKAGTTLLQSLLDGGRAMVMLPDELKLKYMSRPGWPDGKSAARWYVEKGRSCFPDLFKVAADDRTVEVKPDTGVAGLSRAELEEILDLRAYASGLEGLMRDGTAGVRELIEGEVCAFVGALKEGPGQAVCWGSKEVGGDPGHVTSLFRKCFPEGRVVYLVRQPEFISRSIIMDRRRKGKRMSFRRLVHECRDAQEVVNFGLRHALDGGLVVSYEALTGDTPAITDKICSEVGLPADPVHSGPTTLGRAVVVVTSSRQTTKVFRQESDWTKDLTAREKFAIRFFRLVGPLYYRLKGGRKVPYEELRGVLAAKGF